MFYRLPLNDNVNNLISFLIEKNSKNKDALLLRLKSLSTESQIFKVYANTFHRLQAYQKFLYDLREYPVLTEQQYFNAVTKYSVLDKSFGLLMSAFVKSSSLVRNKLKDQNVESKTHIITKRNPHHIKLDFVSCPRQDLKYNCLTSQFNTRLTAFKLQSDNQKTTQAFIPQSDKKPDETFREYRMRTLKRRKKLK